ncbi:alpha-L-iduronidase isoform X2 [Rhipicephalus sanguineus]|uniref:alpha-L-iduronidase isoform X2 n=1 Tax=Rhipicephalus sanguineus TaxID=34632 RepID=UPI0020C4395F|nr:alpha-L-iduronidase isoform X2 [Rhipicephalus sanguineus]
MLAVVVVLLFCQAVEAESTCLDSDVLYVRRLDAPKQTTSKSFQVFVNASDVVGVLKPFWKSTGFCPPEPHNDPEFFLGDDMQQNLIYIASVPGYGATQVRMHWLLDLVNASASSEMGGSTTFDFGLLDTLLDRLRALGLKPGLELMGNPFPRPLDFEKRADLDLWKELVTALARHYLGLCNYYDACSEGLSDASPLLRLGGPAENLAPSHRSPLAWTLLEHCESGVRLDFISLHQKGNASTADIVNAEMAAMSSIRERCPGLSTKPCINNEADPIKNWAEPYPWRADATYAAMLARLVKSHLTETGSCESLSSDNSFLSYPPQPFSQRTQLARFRMNLTEPHVLFVRKPVHAVQALLGKLASREVSASVQAQQQDEQGPQLGVIATASGSHSLSALLYYSNESTWEPGIEAKVSVRAQLDWSTGSSWAVYQVDNQLTNPYASWVRQGCPPFPSALQLDHIRANEEPRLVAFGTSGAGAELSVELSLPLPSAALVLACGAHGPRPATPRDVRIHRVSHNRTLLYWRQPRDGCTSGYRLLFSARASGPYAPLTERRPLLPLQLIDCELTPAAAACRGPGFVRVGALSLAGGRSALSRPVPWPRPL